MDEMRLKGVRLLALPVCTTLQSGRFGSSSALTHSCCLTVVCGLQVFTEQNLEFQEKILERSGLGDETGLSDGIAAMKDGDVKTTLRAALDESEMVLYDVVENLLAKTNTDPQEVQLFNVKLCILITPNIGRTWNNHMSCKRSHCQHVPFRCAAFSSKWGH